MKVKIDTKEKFHKIVLMDEELSANMTEEFEKLCTNFIEDQPANLIIDMNQVNSMDKDFALSLERIQQQFYDNSRSFVICCLQNQVETFLDQENLLERMNTTITESEAWDIVQMEEIERELLNDEEE